MGGATCPSDYWSTSQLWDHVTSTFWSATGLRSGHAALSADVKSAGVSARRHRDPAFEPSGAEDPAPLDNPFGPSLLAMS
jgi:hypothetical protein